MDSLLSRIGSLAMMLVCLECSACGGLPYNAWMSPTVGVNGLESAKNAVVEINGIAGCELFAWTKSRHDADIIVGQYANGRCGGLYEYHSIKMDYLWLAGDNCNIEHQRRVAVHEFLHGAGFPHDDLPNSIMNAESLDSSNVILKEHIGVLHYMCGGQP